MTRGISRLDLSADDSKSALNLRTHALLETYVLNRRGTVDWYLNAIDSHYYWEDIESALRPPLFQGAKKNTSNRT